MMLFRFKNILIAFVISAVVAASFSDMLRMVPLPSGVPRAHAAATFVQTISSVTGGNGGTTLSATFAAAPAQNNLLIAVIGGNANTVISVPAGWSTGINQSGTPSQAIFYKIAGAGEPSTVTVTVSVSTHLGLQIYEYGGIDTATPFDQSGSSAGTGTAVGSGTLTTSKNDELVVAGLTVNADASNFSAWTNSFTERNDFSSKTGVSNTRSTFGAADRIVGAAGAYTTTATSALSGAWIGQIASFRIASLLTQSTYQWFANADSTGVGSALAAQDSVVTVFAAGNTFRLRLLLHVADAQVLTSGVSLKLQFAAKGTGTCAAPAGGSPAVYTDISAAAGEVRYYNNPTPADGAALTANAGDPTHLGHTVVPESYEEANAFTNAQGAILSGQDGLWDFALVNDSALNSSNYCFRAVYATGAILSSYGVYPELTIGNQPPSLSGTALNGGAAISLVEGTTKSVSVAATATDPNGFSDFASATSTIYRSGVGAACAANNSNCYAVASCSFSSCAGNSCTVTCTASMQFFADPTDIGTFAAETWMGTITVVDKQGASASSTAPAVELNTLYAISTPAAINYGSLNPSTDTGATNQTMVITNTGNAAITIPVSGADMTGPGTIPVSQQKYSLSSFTYSAGGTALTAVSTASGLNLAKPTSTTPVQGTLYWGVGVPNGTPSGSYGGTNTIIAAP